MEGFVSFLLFGRPAITAMDGSCAVAQQESDSLEASGHVIDCILVGIRTDTCQVKVA